MQPTSSEIEEDRLEQGLLLDDDDSDENNNIIYSASFAEDGFLNYKTAQWLLYSLLLTFAWGVGILMFLYLPFRRSVLRRILSSRNLYVTPHAIVYKSIRIENVGVRRPPSDDVQIDGVANPRAFRKAVLAHLSNMRSQAYSRQGSTLEDTSRMAVPAMSPSRFPRHEAYSPAGELVILQKLDDLGSSVKRVQALIEEQQQQISEHAELKIGTSGFTILNRRD